MVVEGVLHPLEGDLLDEVLADDRVHQGVGSVAEPVEPGAGHGVAGGDHAGAVALEPVADAGLHRLVVGRRAADPHVAGQVDGAVAGFDHRDLGPVAEVGVVGDPVADVGIE